MADDADHNRRYERGHQVFELSEDAERTPSALDGVSADAERAERVAGALRAKAIVATVLTGAKKPDGQTDLCKEKDISDTEALACYYMHLFFMHRSLREQPSKTVAAAAASLACKVMDFDCRITDILRANNQHRISEGEAELAEEEQEAFLKKVVKLELLLLRMIKYDFDIEVVAPNLKEITEQILVMVGISVDFLKKHGASDIAQAVDELQPKIFQMAFTFLKDAFFGYGPLMMKPKELAVSAVCVSLRNMRRELPFKGLLHLAKMALTHHDINVNEDRLNAGVREIVKAAKSKNEYAAKLRCTQRWGSGGQVGATTSAAPSRLAVAIPGSSQAISKAPSVSRTASAAAKVSDTRLRAASGSAMTGPSSSVPTQRLPSDIARLPPPAVVPEKALKRKAAAEAISKAPSVSRTASAAAKVSDTRLRAASGSAVTGPSSSVPTQRLPSDTARIPPPAVVPEKALKRKAAAEALDRASLATMTVMTLKTELRRAGLKVSGLKVELIERVVRHRQGL